jgi:hypothetical protein
LHNKPRWRWDNIDHAGHLGRRNPPRHPPIKATVATLGHDDLWRPMVLAAAGYVGAARADEGVAELGEAVEGGAAHGLPITEPWLQQHLEAEREAKERRRLLVMPKDQVNNPGRKASHNDNGGEEFHPTPYRNWLKSFVTELAPIMRSSSIIPARIWLSLGVAFPTAIKAALASA